MGHLSDLVVCVVPKTDGLRCMSRSGIRYCSNFSACSILVAQIKRFGGLLFRSGWCRCWNCIEAVCQRPLGGLEQTSLKTWRHIVVLERSQSLILFGDQYSVCG
jgi:hypothetical protein